MKYYIPEIGYKKEVSLLETRIAEILNKRYLKGNKVLDLGCGYGKLMEAFQHLGKIVVGVDKDEDSEKVCKEKGLEFHMCDMEKNRLPFAKNSIDNITCIHLMEHLKDIPRVLEESYRILKENGRIIIVSPDWRYYYRKYWDDPTHFTPVTRLRVKRFLLGIGFEMVDSRPFRKPNWLKWIWRYFDFPFFVGNEFLLCVAQKPRK